MDKNVFERGWNENMSLVKFIDNPLWNLGFPLKKCEWQVSLYALQTYLDSYKSVSWKVPLFNWDKESAFEANVAHIGFYCKNVRSVKGLALRQAKVYYKRLLVT